MKLPIETTPQFLLSQGMSQKCVVTLWFGLETVSIRALDCEGGNLRYESWFSPLFFQSVLRKNEEVTLPLFEQISTFDQALL